MSVALLGAIIVVVALLYVPGYLLLRGLRVQRVLAVCCAPVLSLCAYGTLPVVYDLVHVPCGVATMVVPVLLAAVLAWALGARRDVAREDLLRLDAQPPVRLAGRDLPFDLAVPALYALCGLAVCVGVFVLGLWGDAAFLCDYDNMTHINAVQAFLDSGRWSSLHVGVYVGANPASIPVASAAGGFYPAAWHDVVALACSISGVSVPVATNAMIVAVCGVAYSLGLYAFLRVLLADDRAAVVLGAFVSLASAAVPWMCVYLGPTLPDMAGRLLVVIELALVLLVVRTGFLRAHVCLSAVLLGCTFVGLALLHPNTAFTAFVFLVPYGAHRLWRCERDPRRRAVLLATYAAGVVVFWVLCYRLPFLQPTLNYRRYGSAGVPGTLFRLVTFGFDVVPAQLALTAAVIAGVVVTVRRRLWWPLVPVAFFGLCYVALCCGWTSVGYWLGAPWYQADVRYPPSFVVYCVPLACVGLSWVLALVRARAVRSGRTQRGALVLACVPLVALAVLNYLPVSTYDVQAERGFETPFGCMRRKLADGYGDQREQVYSRAEQAFVDRVRASLPAGTVVFNAPNDGSMWAYGANELPVYYRDRRWKGLTDDAILIREHLAEYATNSQVREAVRRAGVRYVLVLDRGVSYADGTWIVQYGRQQAKRWAGITAIDDATPGFVPVLAEGDEMRLYQIVDDA